MCRAYDHQSETISLSWKKFQPESSDAFKYALNVKGIDEKKHYPNPITYLESNKMFMEIIASDFSALEN